MTFDRVWQGSDDWSGEAGETQFEQTKDNKRHKSHIDAIFDELLGSYFKGSFTLLYEASCYAVFDVGELSGCVRKCRVSKDTWNHDIDQEK
jgi:hypothetical protein